MEDLPLFPNLGLAVDEQQFVQRLFQELQGSGHLIARTHILAVLIDVDRSFTPKPITSTQTA